MSQSDEKQGRRGSLAIYLTAAGLALTVAWASYLAYWGFSDGGLTTSEQAVVLVAATVPPIVSTGALVTAALAPVRARNMAWISTGLLGAFVLAPALMGFGYIPAVFLLAIAALVTPARNRPSAALS
jgi:hypothetical protein